MSVSRQGVSIVDYIINKDFDWIFREQPVDDWGIDAQIEIKDNEYATGKLIAAQIKSGQSYFKEVDNNYVIYRGKIKHLNYWLKHSLPVIIILYNPDTDDCIWEIVSKEKVEIVSDSSWKLQISKDQKFDLKSKKALSIIADNVTEYERKLNSLILAKPWMEEIVNGNDVILESEEWINKSSGRGSFRLKIIDNKTEKDKTVIDWPLIYFPMQNYTEVFNKVFPWADIEIDKDYYEEFDLSRYKLEECPYDDETGEYYFCDNDSFYEWRELQDSIRPYENLAGEVDCYRLKLSLNELGKTFLKLDEYLEKQNFFNIKENDIK